MSRHSVYQAMLSLFLTQNQIKTIFTEIVMEIYVRDIHNDIIKPSNNGGLVGVVDNMTHKLLISDTTLRSFIPLQVRKMTPKLRQICGCALFIIPKDMQIYLNRF